MLYSTWRDITYRYMYLAIKIIIKKKIIKKNLINYLPANDIKDKNKALTHDVFNKLSSKASKSTIWIIPLAHMKYPVILWAKNDAVATTHAQPRSGFVIAVYLKKLRYPILNHFWNLSFIYREIWYESSMISSWITNRSKPIGTHVHSLRILIDFTHTYQRICVFLYQTKYNSIRLYRIHIYCPNYRNILKIQKELVLETLRI